MAMYLDLDTAKSSFGAHPVIGDLFGSSGASDGASPYGDEYDVDDPSIESKVSALVADADSSQFSVMVDVADGRSIAVEGPPGTGKSQTIVNTIASALSEGKRVLFVAEKMAALDVVKARLEACGIGEFLLPLQASRSTKEQVIKSVKSRLEMGFARDPIDLDNLLSRFQKTRSEIADYIRVMSSTFRSTDLSVHKILGSSILSRDILEKLPEEIQKYKIPDAGNYSTNDRNEISDLCDAVEVSWKETQSHQSTWQGIGLANIDPFQADEILEAAADTADAYSRALEIRGKLPDFSLPPHTETSGLKDFGDVILALGDKSENANGEIVNRLASQSNIDLVKKFLQNSATTRQVHDELTRVVEDPLEPGLPEQTEELGLIVGEFDLSSVHQDDLDEVLDSRMNEVSGLYETIRFFQQMGEAYQEVRSLTTSAAVAACDLANEASREVLALRSDILADPSAAAIFEKGVRTATDLRKRQEGLGHRLSLRSLPDNGTILSHSANMASAGLFSFLSSDYRKAKKFYRSISRNRKFDKPSAVNDLQELAEWVSEVDSFSTDRQLERLMGLGFDGLATDFEPMANVLDFYARIDNTLGGPGNSRIREFLRNAPVDDLISLPRVDASHPVRMFDELTLEDVEKHQIEADEFVSSFSAALHRIKELASSIKRQEGVDGDQLLSLAESLREFQHQHHVSENDAAVREILGDRFKGAKTRQEDLISELAVAEAVVNLDEVTGEALLKAVQSNSTSQLHTLLNDVIKADGTADQQLSELSSLSEVQEKNLREELKREELVEKFKLAATDKEGLLAHSRLTSARNDLEEKGFGFLFDALIRLEEGLAGMGRIFKALLAQEMAREAYHEHGSVLAKYNGTKLDTLRARLADLDRKIIAATREHVCAKIQGSARTVAGNGRGRRSEWTEMALIDNEISKIRAFVPVRDLTRRAGKSLLALKPCWMMSPLAVAQYIEKGVIAFDLVIIDEASQMTPEDAIGALVRGRQAMVVGDTNQLPPTSFFRKLLDDDDVDEDEAVTEESILEIANAVFRPARRLRWHYRSRHGGLIAFSNRHVYGDQLVVFPSAEDDGSDMGVSLKRVDGLYSSGTNPKEAKAMVDAAAEFMRANPNRSLGLVTLNQKQRDLVLEEMDYVLNQNSEAARYVEEWDVRNDGLESFFIKNLENVQGDERDVIFIGTVYGPERPGAPVMQRFGPINGVAGKRRLNVLFSRAKEKIVTFSSMTANDVRAEETGNPGVYMLKRWLEYSASGNIESGEVTTREPDSEFELHVINQIRAMGCEAIPQVGVSGYFIDIGVRHPNWPYGFIMGVECDGATYHSSRSARDRDRLRQEVLEGLGWYLHRIWSTDWFEDPQREAERLRKAILNRLSELDVDPDYEEPEFIEPDVSVCVGDRVVIRYNDDPDRRLTVFLSDTTNDPSNGIVHFDEPLGEAVIGAAVGDEIEVQISGNIRVAVVEEISKEPSATTS